MAMSDRRGSATDRQKQYLRLLYNEAFSKLFSVGYDTTHVADTLSMLQASKEITRLLAAKANNWK